MRSNQNQSGSVTRGVGDRAAGARNVGARSEVAGNVVRPGSVVRSGSVVSKLSMPQMPVEWLDAGSWRLPSGKALAEFALQAGFLAPLLFRADRFGKASPKGSPGITGSGVSESVAQARGKQFGKGDSR
jgi:hypothetical protein